MYVCVPERSVYTCVCRSPWRSSEGAGSPGTELRVVVSLHMDGGTESVSSLQEQQMLWVTDHLWVTELCFAARDGRLGRMTGVSV